MTNTVIIFCLRYTLSLCLSMLLPDAEAMKKPVTPVLALFDPIIDISSSSSSSSSADHTVSLLHRCSSLLRITTSLLTTTHTISLPPQLLVPSPIFDLVFAVLSTTPSSLSLAPQHPNIFPSIIPPFLPTLHIDAVALFTGT